MKFQTSIFAAIIVACFSFSSSHASVSGFKTSNASNDTSHVMLHPDANTIFFDESGNKIDSKKFMNALKSGKYTFVPDMVNGKVASVKLKAAQTTVGMGATAPKFNGTDLKGNPVDLDNLKGKLVILNFWFTGCAPCMQEIPELNSLVDKYKDDNSVVFLAITYDSPAQVKSFLSRKDFKFNQLAGRADVIKQYGINGYPTSMVIDKTGSIAFSLTTYDGTNVQQLDGVIGALKGIK